MSGCHMGRPPVKTVSMGILIFRSHGSRSATLDPEHDGCDKKTRQLAFNVFTIHVWPQALSWYQTPSCGCTVTITDDKNRRHAVKWWCACPDGFCQCYLKRQNVRFDDYRRKIRLAQQSCLCWWNLLSTLTWNIMVIWNELTTKILQLY